MGVQLIYNVINVYSMYKSRKPSIDASCNLDGSVHGHDIFVIKMFIKMTIMVPFLNTLFTLSPKLASIEWCTYGC